ncbi:MAG: TonB family protein [Myxococcales bacterium]|nr:TonB family protein [Myxococcales bacterium]
MVVLFRAVWAAALLFLFASPTAAQAQAPDDGASSEQPARPVVTPPQIKKFVEATYPPEAFAQGIMGRVVVQVLINADGSVREASVVQGAGHGFDEAALEAVRQFEFEPATRNGEPIPAKIHYPYVFEIQAAPEPEPEPEAEGEPPPPPPGRLEGQVLDSDNEKPLAGAEVSLTSEDGSLSERVLTDAEGRFTFQDLPPGFYLVRAASEGLEPMEVSEEISSGEITDVIYRLEEPEDPNAFGAVARIPPPPREVTRRSIGKEQLTRIPGTRGDALRTVELLPGVARPPLGAGLLIVRGSSPSDTAVLFEGLQIPIMYHFGGLTSVINSRMIESIEFYPGNFSVRYGRRRGGVLDVTASELPREELKGVADLNLIDSSMVLLAPINEDASFGFAARRSHLDTVFEGVAQNSNISTIAAPVYWDYQLMGSYRPSNRDKIRLMVYGFSDEFALLFDEPNDSDSALAGNFDFGTQFHRVHGSWRRKLSENVDQDVNLSADFVDLDLGFGDAFKFNVSGTEVFARSEWRGRVTDKVQVVGGLDFFAFPGNYVYTGPPAGQTDGNPEAMQGSFSNRDKIEVSDDFLVVQPAVYLETGFTLGAARLVLGSRIDYFSEIDAFSFDPRSSVHYTLTETTTLKAGVGMFTQPPEWHESSPKLGNDNLRPTRTLHLSAGADQQVTEGIKLGLDGFYKHLYDLVVGTELGQPPIFENGGEGRIYGMELAATVNPRGRFFGYLSYTLMRSERMDHPGQPWRLFDFDQPHILTASAVYRLGRGWEAGATFRLVSGNPNTPIIGDVLNTATGQHSPVFGRVNSARNDAFNRLDLRLEKLWTFDAWKLAFYLDVQNVYNEVNPEGYVYDYEYRKREPIRGLPILPNLGLRGEI